jgi:hypothetical protein
MAQTTALAAPPSHKMRKAGIWLLTIFCFFLALGKGWGTFFTLPAIVFTGPIFIVLQYLAIRYSRGPLGTLVNAGAAALAILYFAFFLCLVGFGDTSDAYLFGFFIVDSQALVVRISNVIAQVAMFLVLPTAVAMVAILIAARRRTKT